jgi:arylsulfatase A-like enzyme
MVGCSKSPLSVPPQRPTHVLLITVDTLRADAIGAYGDKGGATPHLDRLAAAGVRFDRAHAHNVVTLPSHANILSGRYPIDHGVRDNAGFRFPASLDTAATILKSRGYRTGAFISAFPLDSRFGLARGFDVYDDGFVDATPRPAFLEQERKGSETVGRAVKWRQAQGSEPTFSWVHVYEPHFPYRPPEPFAARFRSDPYEGEVAAVDAELAPLIDPILDAGPDARTLVIVTADHGESLGEHGEATHGIFAYEATLRVPLIVYAPQLLGPRVVSSLARHVDVLPTILDAVGVDIPTDLRGQSLLPVARGEPDKIEVDSYFEALSASLNRGWAPLTGIMRGTLKYIDLPVPELYDEAA